MKNTHAEYVVYTVDTRIPEAETSTDAHPELNMRLQDRWSSAHSVSKPKWTMQCVFENWCVRLETESPIRRLESLVCLKYGVIALVGVPHDESV